MRTAAGRSIGSELEAAARVLARCHLPHPRRQAAEIWAGLFDRQLGALWTARDEPVDRAQAARFHAAIERRAAGEPIQYVVGYAGFRTVTVEVDSRVLIPRPETEGLIERVLSWCAVHRGGRWGTAVDVGTGSGCIALSLAVEGRFDRVIATDVSSDALRVAERNAAATESETTLEFRRGALFEPLDGERVAVVVSNPPYLTPEEYRRAAWSVKGFEPELALVGGPDGLAHIRALVTGAREHLVDGGMIALEVDSTRAADALALARRAGWTNARIEDDLFGRPRYLIATDEVVS